MFAGSNSYEADPQRGMGPGQQVRSPGPGWVPGKRGDSRLLSFSVPSKRSGMGKAARLKLHLTSTLLSTPSQDRRISNKVGRDQLEAAQI